MHCQEKKRRRKNKEKKEEKRRREREQSREGQAKGNKKGEGEMLTAIQVLSEGCSLANARMQRICLFQRGTHGERILA